MTYLTNVNLNKNELQNAVVHPLAVAPASPAEGQIYYNSVDKLIYQYNGSAWVPVGELNVLESVSVNGTPLSITNKGVNVVVPTATSDLNNDSGFITSEDVPEGAQASSATPAMDGAGAAGTSTAFARGDHVHPTDTSRMAANLKGVANGVAELDATGKVPAAQLPSFVDDVIEGYYYNDAFYSDSEHTTQLTGESGKIYVDLSTEKTYRWGGSVYAEIGSSLALGETSTTAYRGDRGAEAYTKANAALPKSGGTMTGAIDMGSNKVTSLATPTADADAATKKYVDDTASGLVKTASGTLAANGTSVQVAYTGTLINAYATMNGAKVEMDVSIAAAAVTFSTAAAPGAAVTCTVVYA